MVSSPCDVSGEPADVGDEDPGDGAGDGRLEVLGEATAAAEPGEGAFDHPSTRQHREAFGGVRALDDLDRPGAELDQRGLELFAGIGAVGKDVTQPWIELADRSEDLDGTVPILDVGLVHLQADEVAVGIGDDVALATLDLLARIKALRVERSPPF